MIYFTRKINSIQLNYSLADLLIVRNDRVKDLGDMLGGKLHFHRHVDYIYSQALKLLGLIRFIKHSSLDSLKILHINLILSKLEYPSVVLSNLFFFFGATASIWALAYLHETLRFPSVF
jgi:hypothetical protein